MTLRYGLLIVPVLAVAGLNPAAQAGVVELGPRPYFLVSQMDDGPLKSRLLSCAERSFTPKHFSIGHRGAPLMFPEHTVESNVAAARMGAGILECDVTFTPGLGGGLSTRPERPSHQHEHPGHAAGGKVHAALRAGVR